MKKLLLICIVLAFGIIGCSPESQNKGDEIYNKYNTLNAEYTTLKDNYSALEFNYQQVKATKEELQEVKAENYKLATDYNAMLTKYNVLEAQYNNINSHYEEIFRQLSSTSTTAEDSYNTLVGQYQLLEEQYNTLAKPANWTDTEELKEFLETYNEGGGHYKLDEDGSLPSAGACVYAAEYIRDKASKIGRHLEVLVMSPQEYEKVFGTTKDSYHAVGLVRIGNHYYCIEPKTNTVRKAYRIP